MSFGDIWLRIKLEISFHDSGISYDVGVSYILLIAYQIEYELPKDSLASRPQHVVGLIEGVFHIAFVRIVE